MAAQSVHIDLVEAGAWLPWAFAALDRLAHRPEGRSAAPWVAMLGRRHRPHGILSGAAEPILDGGLVARPVRAVAGLAHPDPGVCRSCSSWRRGSCSAWPWPAPSSCPGAFVQAQSQRAMHDYGYFTLGVDEQVADPARAGPLAAGHERPVPSPLLRHLQPCPRCRATSASCPSWASSASSPVATAAAPKPARWWIWYAIVALGLVLSWGGFTPVSHLFFHLPLFNRQRLLSRNLLEVDLAVAVLFATWLDHMFLSPSVVPADPATLLPATSGWRWWQKLAGPGGWRSDIVLPLIPPAGRRGLADRALGGRTLVPALPARTRAGDPFDSGAPRRLPHHPQRHLGVGHVAGAAPPTTGARACRGC